MVDEIGDAHQILKEKFGEDVVIKKFENLKLLAKNYRHQMKINQFANILEEKSVWQKYGLKKSKKKPNSKLFKIQF